MFTTRPEILGTFGIVTSTHWLGSAAGMAMLERGGNAFDACVATGFVLQVVEPHLVGPVGRSSGGVLFVADAQDRGSVRARARRLPALRSSIIAAKASSSFPAMDLLATVVPGSFDAWMLLLRDHGTMRLRDVLEPAIYYAEKGHPLLPRVSDAIKGPEGILRNRMADLRRGLSCPAAMSRRLASSSATPRLPKPGSAS